MLRFVVKIFIFYVQELAIASDWTEGSATGLMVQRLRLESRKGAAPGTGARATAPAVAAPGIEIVFVILCSRLCKSGDENCGGSVGWIVQCSGICAAACWQYLPL